MSSTETLSNEVKNFNWMLDDFLEKKRASAMR